MYYRVFLLSVYYIHDQVVCQISWLLVFLLQLIADVNIVYGVDVHSLDTQLRQIHDRVLVEARRRCAAYETYVSNFNKTLVDTVEEAVHNGKL